MNGLLASDDNNPEFVGARNPDDALWVEFYQKPIKNDFLSKLEERPVFEDRVFVKIQPPGRQDLRIEVEADETHKKRFPRQWMYYNNTHGSDSKQVGTPVDQWPICTPAMAEMLKAMQFRTVESIAMAGDEAIGRLGMLAGMAPLQLRERARIFLAAAHDSAALSKQGEELKKRDAEIEALKQQMAELMAAVNGKTAAPSATSTPAGEQEAANDERVELAKQYEEKFGKKPHHKLGVSKLREALAA